MLRMVPLPSPTAGEERLCDEPPKLLQGRGVFPSGTTGGNVAMPLPHDALVLVADGRKMLFFRNQGDEGQIDLRTEAHDARYERKDREIKTDAPGLVQQSFGSGRSTYEETDFQQQEEDRWIKDAADELKDRALRNDYDALAIVAPPKALGVLRKCLHKEVEKRLLCTVNKEMSGRPVPDIEALLVGETQAELPNA
jgi:protein required for attachment to host cells